jgi:hypothetical protein
MNVKQIVIQWLEENRYKGLINEEVNCQCYINDDFDVFMSCYDANSCEVWPKKENKK